jgi:PqqA peptide cyclase
MDTSASNDLADTCRPRLAQGVRMHVDRLTGRSILLFPEAVIEIKGSGAAIIPLCDGGRTFGEIIEFLTRQFQAPLELLRGDVTRYLRLLRQRRLVEFEDTYATASTGTGAGTGEPVAALAPEAPAALSNGALPRPLGLIAEVSYRCPLHCPYCSNPTSLAPGGGELDTAEWQRVLGEAAEIGVLHALFSGGEPLARSDLESLVARAREVGLYTNLITSGIGFSGERARALKSAGLDSVQISFQSDQPELADSIAGAKVHARKLEAATIARDLEFPLTINVVLHRLNIGRLAEIIELAERLGARRLELASTQYYGWAMRNRAELLPSRQQVVQAAEIAANAQERLGGRIDVLYVIPDYFEDRPKPCMNGWARQYISINPVGDVLPCPTAGEIKSLRFDNVREHELGWIWRNSEAFNRFRGTAWMPNPCRTCDRREIDFGGCRCQAAMITGDAANTDPVCGFSPHRRLIDHALTAAEQVQQIPTSGLLFRTDPAISCGD